VIHSHEILQFFETSFRLKNQSFLGFVCHISNLYFSNQVLPIQVICNLQTFKNQRATGPIFDGWIETNHQILYQNNLKSFFLQKYQ